MSIPVEGDISVALAMASRMVASEAEQRQRRAHSRRVAWSSGSGLTEMSGRVEGMVGVVKGLVKGAVAATPLLRIGGSVGALWGRVPKRVPVPKNSRIGTRTFAAV